MINAKLAEKLAQIITRGGVEIENLALEKGEEAGCYKIPNTSVCFKFSNMQLAMAKAMLDKDIQELTKPAPLDVEAQVNSLEDAKNDI